MCSGAGNWGKCTYTLTDYINAHCIVSIPFEKNAYAYLTQTNQITGLASQKFSQYAL